MLFDDAFPYLIRMVRARTYTSLYGTRVIKRHQRHLSMAAETLSTRPLRFSETYCARDGSAVARTCLRSFNTPPLGGLAENVRHAFTTAGCASANIEEPITMKNSDKAKPPAGLSQEAARWWKLIVEQYEIDDDAGRLLLQTALESLDRLREAQAVLLKDGIVVKDRFGQPRQHPATLVERDAKNMLLRALKSLNLDVAPGAPLK
jgi:P27 family predicted phage terminase small subunit